jgi:hypothetical protein
MREKLVARVEAAEAAPAPVVHRQAPAPAEDRYGALRERADVVHIPGLPRALGVITAAQAVDIIALIDDSDYPAVKRRELKAAIAAVTVG